MLHAEFKSVAVSSLPKLTGAPEPSLRRPVLRTSLVGGVYQHLLEAILSGALPAGVELNEVALSKELQVSRTPVHEALRRLAADGLLEQLLSGKSRVISFSRENIQALYEMRKILEGAATGLAASAIDAPRLLALRQEAGRLDTAPSDAEWPARAISFDLHFHDMIAESSGNEYLRKDILRHRRLVQGFCRVTGTVENLRAAFAEHLVILEALEARDSAGARDSMVRHIDLRMRTLLRLFDENPALLGTGLPPAVRSSPYTP